MKPNPENNNFHEIMYQIVLFYFIETFENKQKEYFGLRFTSLK